MKNILNQPWLEMDTTRSSKTQNVYVLSYQALKRCVVFNVSSIFDFNIATAKFRRWEEVSINIKKGWS